MRFDDIVVGHVEWLARLAFRFYPRKQDAADLAQDTLVRILTNRDKFNDSMDFKPWAMTVMANIFKTREARRARIPFYELDDMILYTLAQTDQQTENADLIRLIGKYAKKSINIECVMLYANGYKYDEISKIKNISIGTVKSRILYGRKMLVELLGQNVN